MNAKDEVNRQVSDAANVEDEAATDRAFAAALESPLTAPVEDRAEPDLQAQLAEAQTRALRYQADLENYRRRARREADELLKYANLPLISELLECYDNLLRALDCPPQSDAVQNVLSGVQMVARQIQAVLEKYGCQPIETADVDFDPNFHQAVQMIDDATRPPGRIVQELRPGYRLHDRVIRPAQVVVVKHPP